MDKKEIIEEMAELTTGCVNCRAFGECFSKCSAFISNRIKATILVREGYTKNKIPEGSVVLSKEEYNDLKGLENRFDDYLIKEIKETRKETAKEILDEIMSVETEEEKWLKNEPFVRYVNKMLNKIEELAKQYGVKV